MARLFFEYAKLMRLPGLGGLSIGPIFGALSLVEIGVKIDLKIIGILFLIGVLKSIFGFVLNDYADIEIDRLSLESKNRPLVKGTISKRVALLICLICLILVYSIVTYFFYNQPLFNLTLICITIAAIVGTIYNLYGKKFPGSDFLVGLAEGLFVLVGAFIVSTNGYVSIITWIIFILVFNQYLFMNAILGGVKDAENDFKRNVKNIALGMGVRVKEEKKIIIPIIFKIFGLGIRLISSIIVFLPFLYFGVDYELWHIILLALFVIPVLIITIILLNTKSLEKMDEITKSIGLQGVLRYCFVPVLLVPIIGLPYAFLLVIFPLVWYILFTPLSGTKLFKDL